MLVSQAVKLILQTQLLPDGDQARKLFVSSLSLGKRFDKIAAAGAAGIIFIAALR
jgi:hypothetical protein